MASYADYLMETKVRFLERETMPSLKKLFKDLGGFTFKMQYSALAIQGELPWGDTPDVMFAITVDLGPSPSILDNGVSTFSQLYVSRRRVWSSSTLYETPPSQMKPDTVEKAIREELKKAVAFLKKDYPIEDANIKVAHRKTARMEYDHEFRNDHVWVQWNERPTTEFLITELPGKPVKRKVRTCRVLLATLTMQDPSMSQYVIDHLRLTPSTTFDSVIEDIITLRDTFLENSDDPDAGFLLSKLSKKPSIYTISYLEVPPVNYKPMKFNQGGFKFSVEWDRFKHLKYDSDRLETAQSYSEVTEKSPEAARKLFKVLKADPKAFQDLCRDQATTPFMKWLDKAGIGYNLYHSFR